MKYSIEEFKEYDKVKSKVMKYVLFKKRTEQEVRQKFSKDIEKEILDDIIDELKENSYIDDYNYIEKAINEFVNLKSLSIKEVKYKLLSKGIKSHLIDEYILKNDEILQKYEQESAYKIMNKKRNCMEQEEISMYLLKKGYQEDNIRKVLIDD